MLGGLGNVFWRTCREVPRARARARPTGQDEKRNKQLERFSHEDLLYQEGMFRPPQAVVGILPFSSGLVLQALTETSCRRRWLPSWSALPRTCGPNDGGCPRFDKTILAPSNVRVSGEGTPRVVLDLHAACRGVSWEDGSQQADLAREQRETRNLTPSGSAPHWAAPCLGSQFLFIPASGWKKFLRSEVSVTEPEPGPPG